MTVTLSLGGKVMANEEHRGILRQGVKAWNAWRESNPNTMPDLHEANLRGVNLRGAYLSEADLHGADLSGANLSEANLHEANLHGEDLSGADLSGAELFRADLHEADLSRAHLEHARIVQTDVTDAKLDSCHVYGISVWDLKGTAKSQQNLVITRSYTPVITVDDLEVAQFVYLLLKHQKLRDVINAVTQRGVLILGRFSGGGLEVLQAVAQKLREEKYLPIIFDFDRPEDRDYTETVKTLVGLSRFVIVDLSGPSVPQELYATVPHFKIPFVPIVETGRKPYSMVADLFEYPWFLNPPVEFSTKEELIQLMPSKVISPAEERHKERQSLLDRVFRT
ncbi:MAG: pentapeptide repeat-containing protein [Syntrophobacteraceae bacterium]